MKTAMMLLVQYEGLSVIPVDWVCRDYFRHLSPEKFIRKASDGDIDIPLVRIEGSKQCSKGVPLPDLARYIDMKFAEARLENDKIFGRKPDQSPWGTE